MSEDPAVYKTPNTPDIPWAYPLFEHMSREHGLTLLDSELDEIIRVVRSLTPENHARATRGLAEASGSSQGGYGEPEAIYDVPESDDVSTRRRNDGG